MYIKIDLEQMTISHNKYNETKEDKYLVALYNDIKALTKNVLYSNHYYSARSRLKHYEIQDVIDEASFMLLKRIMKKPDYKVDYWITVVKDCLRFALFNPSQKTWNLCIYNGED